MVGEKDAERQIEQKHGNIKRVWCVLGISQSALQNFTTLSSQPLKPIRHPWLGVGLYASHQQTIEALSRASVRSRR